MSAWTHVVPPLNAHTPQPSPFGTHAKGRETALCACGLVLERRTHWAGVVIPDPEETR